MLKVFAAVMAVALVSQPAEKAKAITQQDLVDRTRQMFDAVARGDTAPWERYVADDALYFNERGRKMTKSELIADLSPLPTGYSGTLKLLNPASRRIGETAVLSYDLEETEIVYGQKLNARYHGTDTWLFRSGQWQILAGQMFRYYEDPSPESERTTPLDDYVGRYQLAAGVTITIRRDGKELYAKRNDKPEHLLKPESGDVFFRPGIEGRYVFRRDANGKLEYLIDRRNNEDLIWKKL